MNEFLKTLMNIRSLRVAIRELPFDQLQEAKEKFDLVFNERAETHEAEAAARQAHQEQLATFTEMLKEAGIDPLELVNGNTAPAAAAGTTKSKRAPRPAKYQYEEDGQTKTWTGQGRMPKTIAEAVAEGRSIDEFLIEKPE